jgi:hypothetical protein
MSNSEHVNKARAEKATVRLLRPGKRGKRGADVPVGQGVLVPGGFIITAAHCIDWDAKGAMVLGDHFFEMIKASNGTTYKVSPYAVEPVHDIAALGAVDGQELFDECRDFEEFCEVTEAVPVSTDDFEERVPVPVHVLTHAGAWIAGRACRHSVLPGGLDGSVAVEFDGAIECGTSGGPVVDENGLLVGVISNFSEGPNLCGSLPRPHLALPVWVLNRIFAVRPRAMGRVLRRRV